MEDDCARFLYMHKWQHLRELSYTEPRPGSCPPNLEICRSNWDELGEGRIGANPTCGLAKLERNRGNMGQ